MQVTVEIIGFKAFRGVIDGKTIDSGSVFSKVKMDTRNNSRKGQELNCKGGEAVEEWKLGSAELGAMFENKVPCVARLELERVTNGKETKEVVIGVEIVSHAKLTAPERIAKAA